MFRAFFIARKITAFFANMQIFKKKFLKNLCISIFCCTFARFFGAMPRKAH